MYAYIKSVTLNEFDGIFNQVINFNNSLNILSGENGTGKTTVIKKIKEFSNNNSPEVTFKTDDPSIQTSNQLEIFALSPKRNSEKQNLDKIINRLRQQNKTFDTFYNETKQKLINDSTFGDYSSFGELFYYYHEINMKPGTFDPITVMNNITREFNEVLQQVFPDYTIISNWDNGKPNIKLKVADIPIINLNELSCGQQEILSLMFNLYASREKYHIYLIDEPEIHLNWNLERGLFEYFDWFCSKFSKQIITTTHSRIIFKDNFYKKTKFLIWKSGKIFLENEINNSAKEAIVSEMASAVTVVAPTSKTFFVEDRTHKYVIETLGSQLDNEVEVVVCGNCENVKSLFRCSKGRSWQNKGYFLIDGDNQGTIKEFMNEVRFIKLDRYSIESYLFNLKILSSILSVDEDKVKEELLSIIQGKREKIFRKGGKASKFASDLVMKLDKNDINDKLFETLDCSEIIIEVANNLNIGKEELIDIYLSEAKKQSLIDVIFDTKLIEAISS